MSAVLAPPRGFPNVPLRRCRLQADTRKDHLDWQVLRQVQGAVEELQPVRLDLPIRNVHRAVGAILSHHIYKRRGASLVVHAIHEGRLAAAAIDQWLNNL